MGDWLLVLALNFSDGGSQVTHTPVPSKEACSLVLRASIGAYVIAGTARFRWSATCVDLKNGKLEAADAAGIPGDVSKEELPRGQPGTQARS